MHSRLYTTKTQFKVQVFGFGLGLAKSVAKLGLYIGYCAAPRNAVALIDLVIAFPPKRADLLDIRECCGLDIHAA